MKRKLMHSAFILMMGLMITRAEAHGRPGHVWVKPHALTNGIMVAGHWRVSVRAGFVWVDGAIRNGHWTPGYWKPSGKTVRGKVWVPGHPSPKGEWIEGYWRPSHKRGWTWIEGFVAEDGHYVEGHWKRK